MAPKSIFCDNYLCYLTCHCYAVQWCFKLTFSLPYLAMPYSSEPSWSKCVHQLWLNTQGSVKWNPISTFDSSYMARAPFSPRHEYLHIDITRRPWLEKFLTVRVPQWSMNTSKNRTPQSQQKPQIANAWGTKNVPHAMTAAPWTFFFHPPARIFTLLAAFSSFSVFSLSSTRSLCNATCIYLLACYLLILLGTDICLSVYLTLYSPTYLSVHPSVRLF